MKNNLLFKRSAALGVFLVAISILSAAFALPAAAYYDSGDLAGRLPNASASLTSIESSYNNTLANYVASCGNTRNCLNASGTAYWRKVWLSPAGHPAATSYTLPSTVKTVPLQLNIFQFLTASTAAKNTGSNQGLGTLRFNSSAANFVKSGNYPADRNPATNALNKASQDVYRAQIRAVSIISVNGASKPGQMGTITGFSPYSVMSLVKNSGSRYWFGNPIGLTYNAPPEWEDARNDVKIRFYYKEINRYNGSVWQCGNGVNTSDGNYKCGENYADYTFRFIVTPVWILSPHISAVPETASVGESITPDLKVTNTGKGYSEATRWAVSAMVFGRNDTVPATETLSNNNGSGPDNPRMEKPCQHFQSLGATSCTTEQSSSSPGQAPQNFTELTTESVNGNHTIPVRDYPIGTKVCYALSIYSRDNGTIDQTLFPWAHSAPMCLIIGKKPKVQITGGDLIVGTGAATNKNVSSSSSQKAIAGVQKVFGSWVEYGIAATGTVTGTASGAGYSGGGSTLFCAASLLTFSNLAGPSPGTCTSGTIGNYESTKGLPNIASRLATSKSTLITGGSFDVGAAEKGIYSSPERTADLTVTSSAAIATGKWVVVYVPKAKVIIGSDIKYTNTALDPLKKASDIPQVLIIADSIDIPGGVGQIDSWLIATGVHGVINTCNDVAVDAPLTVNICSTSKLTVNGPVVSKQLYLRRTIGSETGASSGDPAEVFNLRPDAYLWATEWSAAAGRLQTVYTKELPPRF